MYNNIFNDNNSIVLHTYIYTYIHGSGRGIMVIFVDNGDGFKSWMRLFAFHIVLMPLIKFWIYLFTLQLWGNSLGSLTMACFLNANMYIKRRKYNLIKAKVFHSNRNWIESRVFLRTYDWNPGIAICLASHNTKVWYKAF